MAASSDASVPSSLRLSSMRAASGVQSSVVTPAATYMNAWPLKSAMKRRARIETLMPTPKDPVNGPTAIDWLLCCERSTIWVMIPG